MIVAVKAAKQNMISDRRAETAKMMRRYSTEIRSMRSTDSEYSLTETDG
jgi:hypothetical protein